MTGNTSITTADSSLCPTPSWLMPSKVRLSFFPTYTGFVFLDWYKKKRNEKFPLVGAGTGSYRTLVFILLLIWIFRLPYSQCVGSTHNIGMQRRWTSFNSRLCCCAVFKCLQNSVNSQLERANGVLKIRTVKVPKRKLHNQLNTTQKNLSRKEDSCLLFRSLLA